MGADNDLEQLGIESCMLSDTVFYHHDRERARTCIHRLLGWPFERVVLAHGDFLTDSANALEREGLGRRA
ncbi:hypothetical protein [Paraburkholderia sp. CNPSo 3274]|uniref:hypothetical protein n=1 Tax=Paraburkholderia sp. CNPSo 3274 TaxID=2940932 RepID=UPI0020B7026E|nr:hypothetical protein [Paraburkholderia sp. CNPSo 3274]